MKCLVLIISLIFLYGCNLEPRLKRPCLNPPLNWRTFSDDTTTLANIRFWESLGDPVLNELIYLGLNNNRDLLLAAWRVIQFYGQYLEVRSQLFPQLNVQGTALKEKFSQVNIPAGLNTDISPIYTYSFNVSYEIDLWGKLWSETHEAWEELLAQVENRRTVVLTLCSAIASGYITLRQLDKQLEISYLTLKARKYAMEIARERFEGGLTSEIEVTQAVSLFDEAQTAVVNLEEQIPIQENLISLLIGANPSYILRGRTLDNFSYPAIIPTGIPSEVLVRRPDILQAEHLLIASNANIAVARAAFLPQISLTGLYGGESFELRKLFSKPFSVWQIGGSFFQPLFTGGFLTGQLIAAIAENREAYMAYEQTALNAFKEVDDALVSHEQAKKRVLVQADRVSDLKLYLELSWLRYYEGQTDYLTVLDASTELFDEELSLALSQGEVFTTLVDIYKALGGGWVVDADCNLRKRKL